MAVVANEGVVLTAGRRRGGSLAFWASTAFLVVVVVAGVLAPLIAPYDPTYADFSASLAGASPTHPLGTDQSGQDILSRLIYGARTSLVGPLLILVLAVVLGTPLGILAAWRGGWVDTVVSRATDVLIAFPGLLFAILVIAIMGKSATAAVAALGLAFAPAIAKLVRSAARTERNQPYVAAYQVLGVGGWSICLLRLLPRVLPLVLGYAIVLFGDALMGLAGLSYLGFGVQSPAPDWGLMVSEGQLAMLQGAPLPSLVPAIAIAATVVAFNVVGVRVADRLGVER